MHKILLIVLVLLAIAFLSLQNVSAQAAVIQIINVAAPSTVAAGQPLTVAVTISFHLQFILTVIIAVVPTSEGGAPYPASAVSGSPYSCADSTTSACDVVLPFDTLQGNTTASFTFNAPNQVGVWKPVAVVYVGSSLVDSKAMQVSVSQPIPETTFPTLVLVATLTIAAYLSYRRRVMRLTCYN
ncbi:MAG TPA: hypothetical protein VLV31_08115 [Candidatus Acidoferrales bacterium]|nr:hypothetical protein [Candidatus Acidoferrales bacterium]